MIITKASAEVWAFTPDLELLIERAGRVCYRSEDKITEGSARKFIARLAESKHHSVLEHGAITVSFIVDRGISHEIVRHRIASYSQESTRYVAYNKTKFGGQIEVIHPCFLAEGSIGWDLWLKAMQDVERAYLEMIREGLTPQEARSVLPNSLKTQLVMTANAREWEWFFQKRCHQTAHPQMREVAIPLLADFKERWPSIYSHLQF